MFISKMETDTNDTNDTSSKGANGNTSVIRGRIWMFTWNNYSEEEKCEIIDWSQKQCIDCKINPEKGENGTPHLQGYWEFKSARAFSSLHKQWPKLHLEKARNKEAAKAYCMKEDTRDGDTFDMKAIKDPLKGKELYEWQQEIINIIKEEPDERTIYWYWDKTGGGGKTSLAKHLCIKMPDRILYLQGKANDLKYGVACFVEKNPNKLKCCIFDFSRSIENFVSYEGIECIKNGIFYNNKYESKMILYDNPHIIIFANFKPEKKKLSQDRWKITRIDNNNLDSDSESDEPDS